MTISRTTKSLQRLGLANVLRRLAKTPTSNYLRHTDMSSTGTRHPAELTDSINDTIIIDKDGCD